MRVGCLQFAPRIGKVGENIRKADELLEEAGESCSSLDLLVLSEMAFSGMEHFSFYVNLHGTLTKRDTRLQLP